VLIDWFTVAAQIVNFLVLVALLKYFLYGRITRAMDEREARIASRLEEAEQEKQKADEKAEEYERRNRELEEQREKLLSDAKQEAESVRKELTEEARRDVEKARSRWEDSLEKEKSAFLSELRERMGKELIGAAQKTLGDLADSRLQKEVVRAFSTRVRQLDADRREELAAVIRDGGGRVLIRSATEPDENDREALEKLIHEELSEDIRVDFEQNPDLVCGISLNVRGHKVSWNVQSYLQDLEQSIAGVLSHEKQPDTTSAEEEGASSKKNQPREEQQQA
jgi:F-type H+-transporting ATPase subunit b